MRLERIIEQVYCRPWAITPERHRAIRQLLEARINGASILDWEPDDAESNPYDVVGSVGVIPVEGVILNKCSGLEAMCGAFSCEDFRQSLRALASDGSVSSIVLNIASGGGTITGVPETADLIAEVSKAKPTYAYTNDVCASAAYWLASQCTAIFASKSAEVGSIGVYLALLDVTRAMEMEGVKLELFKAGQYKATGFPGKPLSDDERAMLQAGVDKSYEQFTSYVTARRKVDAEAMQGQVFGTDEAMGNGLVDAEVNELDSLIGYLNGG